MQRHQLVRGFGPARDAAIEEADEDQSLAMLGHAISKSVQDTGLNVVTQPTERLAEPHENGSVPPTWEVRHVFDENCGRPQMVDDLDEALPEIRPRIVFAALAALDEL